MENKYKVGQIVYWMYNYSSVFPNFYKIVKTSEKSIWVVGLESNRSDMGIGYSEYKSSPVDIEIDDNTKGKRIQLDKDGNAYFKYYGHYKRLCVWEGNDIQCYSD